MERGDKPRLCLHHLRPILPIAYLALANAMHYSHGMELLWFAVCAFLFSAGDYYSSLAGVDDDKQWMPLLGAVIGGFAYIVFGHLSKTTPLSALGGYINGAVVCITCVYFGWFVQGNKISAPEWLWLGVILTGILGLAYARSA